MEEETMFAAVCTGKWKSCHCVSCITERVYNPDLWTAADYGADPHYTAEEAQRRTTQETE